MLIAKTTKVGSMVTYTYPVESVIQVTITPDTSAFIFVQSMGLRFESNFNTSISLGRNIYIYSFGDKPTPISISGLLYFDCSDPNSATIQNFFNYFNSYKISNSDSGLQTVTIQIGDKAISCILVASSLSIQDPRTGMVNADLSLIYIPDSDEIADTGRVATQPEKSSEPVIIQPVTKSKVTTDSDLSGDEDDIEKK